MTFLQVVGKLAFVAGMWGAMLFGFSCAWYLVCEKGRDESGAAAFVAGFVISSIVSCFILAALFWGFK